MDIEFDENKSIQNEKLRGLSFLLVAQFQFKTAMTYQDFRHNDEIRMKSTGFIEDKLYTLIFTLRNSKIRVISLRNASRKERKDYEAKSKSH